MPTVTKRLPFSSSAPDLRHNDDDDDDDFQIPPTQALTAPRKPTISYKAPLKPSNNLRLPKKPKLLAHPGKENAGPERSDGFDKFEEACSLELIPSSIDYSLGSVRNGNAISDEREGKGKGGLLEINAGYSRNSIESRLLGLRSESHLHVDNYRTTEDFEEGNELGLLLELSNEVEEEEKEGHSGEGLQCPLCGVDISELSEDHRQVHTNGCLDRRENQYDSPLKIDGEKACYAAEVITTNLKSHQQAVEVSPVAKWLSNLGLARYTEAFVQGEIDWDSLQLLTEEDLFEIGVTALGPRKKILHALSEFRKKCVSVAETREEDASSGNHSCRRRKEMHAESSSIVDVETNKLVANKLITDYFPGMVNKRKNTSSSADAQCMPGKHSGFKHAMKSQVKARKLKDIPSWCCIPGTPFRVDAFKYLRADCSHWFLTHFHMDHYQGLTRSFCHGKIYCSSITAKLVNMKLGIQWDRLQVLPLNQKIDIAGIEITCIDANHCPGSIMILFEPPNGKAVLHTGDFRLSEEMTSLSLWNNCPVHTLILDTTYCNPQYDFPMQEAVIQFVIEAIQAETFNPSTLFLIGSYTIGKERLFLQVARILRRKVYVTSAKLRLLECFEFSDEEMRWFTSNEQESNIHVVPMWTVASFKRLKYLSNQYASRFSLIVAFSPTGWTFGKGKKKSPGRRWQQGTIIRYEVPYSEHCSFTELKEFVRAISPENIIPSVNNDGPESATAMVSLLLS